MQSLQEQMDGWLLKQQNAPLRVQTLGDFCLWRHNQPVPAKEWGRDKTIQLFQFLITARRRNAMHKEQILDRLWEEDSDGGDQIFKVALHGINKVLEPDRKSHSEPRFITRQGLTYRLHTDEIWIDADAQEAFIAIGNQALNTDPALAHAAYRSAIELNKGIFLPDRIYEDWSCDERERIQVLALGAIMNLAELLLEENPLESIRLSQQALLIDNAWEEAWRVQMEAYFRKGNRPMAIKTYRHCEKVLLDSLGIAPLPETRKLFQSIMDT